MSVASDFECESRWRQARGERDEVSACIGRIWRAILRTEQIAEDANFFALGGTSLSALRTVLQLHGELGVEVPLGVLFESPTMAALVDAVIELRTEAAGPAPADPTADPPPPTDPVARGGDELRRAPASLFQVAQLIPSSEVESSHLNWVYQLNGRLDVAALASAIDDVVRRHEILRARFECSGGRWCQVAAPFTPGVLTIVDLRGRPKLAALDAAVERIEAAYRARSVLEAPWLQAFLYTIDPKTSVFAMFVAEALADSDSGPLIAAEIARAYAAHAGHAEPASLPVPVEQSYLDHVASHPPDRAVLRRAREHWEHQARSAPPIAGWPMVERDRPSTSAFHLEPEAWTKLLHTIQAMGTTAYVFVLAGFQIALARSVDASQFLVHSTVSDRSDPVTERMIGAFQSPVRIEARVHAADRFSEVVARTSAAVCAAITHCALPAALAGDSAAGPGDGPAALVRFHMFDHHEGPVFAGIRRRRFRLHSASSAPLKLNCIRGPSGRQDFVFASATACEARVSRLVRTFRAVLDAGAADPEVPIGAIAIAPEDLVGPSADGPAGTVTRSPRETV